MTALRRPAQSTRPLAGKAKSGYACAVIQNNAPRTDHELMAAAGRGDQGAYTILVDRHLNKALSYVTRLLQGDRSTAEDIVQDGFLRVWQHAATWEPQAQFNTWFYTALYRLCVDHWRRNKRRMVELDEMIEDPSVNAEAQFIDRQQQRVVTDALNDLPDKQRHALMLFHQTGLSQNDIAHAMQLTVGAVESLLFRGRQRLRSLLSPAQSDQTTKRDAS